MGRPRATINWDEVRKLASYQCTQEEIANFFEVCLDTLQAAARRDLGISFSEFWRQNKGAGRVKLRKAQFKIVESGGPGAATMAIWLDKKMFPDERPIPDAHLLVSAPIEAVKKKSAKLTFEDFCVKAGYPRPFPKQVEMKNFASTANEPSMILGARGYGKSDYVTVLGVAYDIYSDFFDHKENGSPLSETNLVISKSRVRNTAMIEEIAEALKKNEVPLEKENSSCVRVEGLTGKDHSVEMITIKSSFRGRHPKRITMDDPVTEEDTSEAMRTLVKKKYDEAYKLCKNIVIIGQPAHEFDLYAELRDSLRKMEIPHGSIPELDADLEAMKLAGVSAHSIEMSYRLRIPKDGSSIFSNLKFLDKFPVGGTGAVAFIDPSEGGDYTAISVVKGYMDGVAAEGRAWKKAWYHCLDEIMPFVLSLGVKKICFETNCTGDNPLFQLRGLFGPKGIGVAGKRSDSNKHAAILAAGSYAHLIHLSKDSDKIYTNQVVKYEYSSKHDDAPDSLARCLEWIGLLKGRK